MKIGYYPRFTMSNFMFFNGCAYCGSKGRKRLITPEAYASDNTFKGLRSNTQPQVCSFNLTDSIYSIDWKLAQFMFVYCYPLYLDN